jgi:N-acetyl-beta-hexosaminidase
LDVSNNASLAFVNAIWRDLVLLFPSDDVFIGGDECHTQCWGANEKIAAWAADKNLTIGGTGEGTVFGWFIDKIVDTVHGKHLRPYCTPLSFNVQCSMFNVCPSLSKR